MYLGAILQNVLGAILQNVFRCHITKCIPAAELALGLCVALFESDGW
jgi:hypothetical protein